MIHQKSAMPACPTYKSLFIHASFQLAPVLSSMYHQQYCLGKHFCFKHPWVWGFRTSASKLKTFLKHSPFSKSNKMSMEVFTKFPNFLHKYAAIRKCIVASICALTSHSMRYWTLCLQASFHKHILLKHNNIEILSWRILTEFVYLKCELSAFLQLYSYHLAK